MPFGALIGKVAAPLLKTAAAKILPKALPAVRSVLGGVGKAIGATGAIGGTVAGGYTIGQAVGDYMAQPSYPVMPAQSIDMSPWQTAGALPVARGPIARPGGSPPMARAPAAGGAGYALGQAAGRRVRGLIDQFGRKWSARRVAALARKLGVEAAAAALGVGAVMVVDMVAQDSMTAVRRRRKGISFSQLSTTRKTLRKIESMNRYLCRPAGVSRAPVRRAKACR